MIDAHHHIWTLSRGGYGWNTPGLAIHRDYGLDDLRPLLGEIRGTILVQASEDEGETDFMLDAGRAAGGLVRGVVGWVDLGSPSAPARVAARAADPLIVGLRPVLQDLADREWILRPEVAPGLAAMARHRLVFDALVLTPQLRQLPVLAARHPDLVMVLDHAGKPPIARGEFEPWATDIAAVARETGAACKLSGLVTEAAPGWTVEDLRPYVEHILACFGPARVLWGSDWPVVNLGGGYDAWRAATTTLLAGLDHDDRAAILGGTALRLYGARSGA